MIKRLISLLVLLVCIPGIENAQTYKSVEHRLSTSFLQVDEELNYGIIFPGPGLGYDFSINWENERYLVNYTASFGFNYLQSRKIASGNINLVPLKLSYLFKSARINGLSIGPQVIADYNYQVYPDLQSGYSFWFTHLSFGAISEYNFLVYKDIFRMSLETSIGGFTSRSKKYEDPYFYDLSFLDVMKFVHNDFNLGTIGSYNYTGFQIRWQPNPESRLAVAYNLKYHGYFKEPQIKMLNHMVTIILLSKKNRE